MGKTTISMAIFNSKLLVITRGYEWRIAMELSEIWDVHQPKLGKFMRIEATGSLGLFGI